MSSIEPDDRSSEVNRSQKVDCTFVIPNRNGSILLEEGKEVFNSVVELCTIVCHTRAESGDCAWAESPPSCLGLGVARCPVIRIVGFVSQHGLCQQVGQQLVCPIQVTRLPWREVEVQGVAQSIRSGMNLPAQSPFAAANCFGVWLGCVAKTPDELRQIIQRDDS